MKVINYILKSKGKILLQKRDNKSNILYPGEWCFPGGMVEKNEKLFDACIRECREETGVIVNKIEYLCDHYYSTGQKSRFFIVEGDGDVISNEGKMYWKTLEEIKEIKLADNQNEIIKKL